MRLFQKIIDSLYRRKHRNEPWLEYYSREERKIKFTKKSIYHFMMDSSKGYSNLIALNYFENRISYKEMFNNIDIVSRGLREFGVKPGDVVTVCMPNMPEAIYIFYACNKIGAVCDIIHPLSSALQIKFYLQESKSRFLFLVDFNYEKFNEIKEDTLVYRTILVSPKESMPFPLNLGYSITRGLKTKKPKRNEHEYMKWREFLLYGVMNKKDYESKQKTKPYATFCVGNAYRLCH